jgi:beta-mannosidase
LDSHGQAEVCVPDVRRWRPHTHGEPWLYPTSVELRLEDYTVVSLQQPPVGFCCLESEAGTLDLIVNGVHVFCRGVVWPPMDAIGLGNDVSAMRQRLTLLRDGGCNMIRIPGTMLYESDAFHQLCDELGLLVWQDMMFANMDYPFADEEFHATVCREAVQQCSRLAQHPSTAVLCGNSEIEQQVGMLGLDTSLGRDRFFADELPALARQSGLRIPYFPSAPCGGDLPFRTDTGLANYFGVGAYLRPLEDVRRSAVRFASECLAFANVPEPELIDKMARSIPGCLSPTHPAWKRGVPRDAGAAWDFEDVRDHYLQSLYNVDPAALRYCAVRRYWELSRLVSGEVMAEVFGEWRRPASRCRGGIVLWASDLEPGAGWGVLDSDGTPKAAYWFLKRALAARTLWITGEGLNGTDVHISNDGPAELQTCLRVALYHKDQRKEEAERAITLPAHQSATVHVEELLGRFVDSSYAYRFGPPACDLIVASLHPAHGEPPFAQAFHFPVGRPLRRVPIADLDIVQQLRRISDDECEVALCSQKLVWGARVSCAPGMADDCYFCLEPGIERSVRLKGAGPRASLTAANAEGVYRLDLEATA